MRCGGGTEGRKGFFSGFHRAGRTPPLAGCSSRRSVGARACRDYPNTVGGGSDAFRSGVARLGGPCDVGWTGAAPCEWFSPFISAVLRFRHLDACPVSRSPYSTEPRRAQSWPMRRPASRALGGGDDHAGKSVFVASVSALWYQTIGSADPKTFSRRSSIVRTKYIEEVEYKRSTVI